MFTGREKLPQPPSSPVTQVLWGFSNLLHLRLCAFPSRAKQQTRRGEIHLESKRCWKKLCKSLQQQEEEQLSLGGQTHYRFQPLYTDIKLLWKYQRPSIFQFHVLLHLLGIRKVTTFSKTQRKCNHLCPMHLSFLLFLFFFLSPPFFPFLFCLKHSAV